MPEKPSHIPSPPIQAAFCQRRPDITTYAAVLFLRRFPTKEAAIAWGKTWWEALGSARMGHFMHLMSEEERQGQYIQERLCDGEKTWATSAPVSVKDVPFQED